jgi:hypothetical protein
MFRLIPIISMVLGLGMLAWCVHAYRRGRQTLSWPSVWGTITGSQMEVSETTESDGTRSRSYTAHVAYKYSVGGRSFDGKQVTPGGSVERYPAGARVKVFYEPANPGYGVLRAGVQYPVVGLLFFFAAMFIGSAVYLW